MIFDRIVIVFSDIQNRHLVSDKIEIIPTLTIYTSEYLPFGAKKAHICLCPEQFNWIFMKHAGLTDRHIHFGVTRPSVTK